MKNILIITFVLLITNVFVSCVPTMALTTEQEYYRQNEMVIHNGVCYVYQTNPSDAFLGTFTLVNGNYFYHYQQRYIPVIFPKWRRWTERNPNFYRIYKDRQPTYYHPNKYPTQRYRKRHFR